MMDQGVAAFTFSKSYSMSGWRLGFAVAGAEIADSIGKMINTTLSCTPPIVQLAGMNALKRDKAERDEQMGKFREKVLLLTKGLNSIPGFKTIDPKATFYVFPNVAPVCNELGITSHGLAMYLLEGADDQFGVACLGGECFGEAGGGFLRFSCAEPNDRLQQAWSSCRRQSDGRTASPPTSRSIRSSGWRTATHSKRWNSDWLRRIVASGALLFRLPVIVKSLHGMERTLVRLETRLAARFRAALQDRPMPGRACR